MIDHEAVAQELFLAMQTATPVRLLTERHPDLTWQDARRIARATDELRVAAGDELIGYKLGWTSAAMRDALGVDRPNWGTLWKSQIVEGLLELGPLIHPKVEPELVYRHDEDGIGEWALGLEVVDPRFPNFSFDALDNTSDNSSSARVAMGEFHRIDEPDTVEVSFTDGTETRTGVGANAMDSPRLAVAWFQEQFSAEGGRLEAGQIVFTGGLTAPFDVTAGRTYRLSAGRLGSVEVLARS